MTTKDFATFVDQIDILVTDLDAATRDVRLLLGVEPTAIGPLEDPIDGTLFGGVEFAPGGVRSLRLVQPAEPEVGALGRYAKEHGDGIWSVTLQVPDLAGRQRAMEPLGIAFELDEPLVSASGDRRNATVADTTDATRLVLIQPDGGMPEHADVFVGAPDSPTKVQRAYVLDLGVADLHASVQKYGAILGIDGIYMDPAMDPSDSMEGCHFPTGGLYNIGLLSPRGEPKGPIPRAAQDYITAHGDGMFLLGFHVDIAAKEDELRRNGVELVFDSPIEYKIGKMSMTVPMHGVSWFYGQWVEEAYEIWREERDAS